MKKYEVHAIKNVFYSDACRDKQHPLKHDCTYNI